MKKVLREIYRNIIAIISSFSPIFASRIYYFTKFHKKLNLKKPLTINEKLMWLKLNEYPNNDLIKKCADKYKVREYIKEKKCNEILNDLIAVYDNAEQIDFNKLPDKFVLKCNHASGYNIICNDKNKLDKNKTKKFLNKWMKKDYWKYVAELQYKDIDKKIVCEKFIDSEDGKGLKDYKIYCFNGKPIFCLVCDERNSGNVKYYYMDKNWEIMKISPTCIEEADKIKIEKPKCMDKMYEYARILAEPFKFVRVDFYEQKDKVIFGELTFTPAGCIDNDFTEEAQIMLGNLLKI